MRGIIDFFKDAKDLRPLYEGLTLGYKEQLLTGLTSSSKAATIAASYELLKAPIAVVTHNLYNAQKVYDDLVNFVGEGNVFIYPVNDLTATEISIASPELLVQRMEVMERLSQKEKGIYIFPVASLRRFITPPSTWKKSSIQLAVGDEIDVQEFLRTLVMLGYERTQMIEGPGQMSVRGGIIDIYPMTEENPIRMELFDTEIDSIRTFYADSQRSIANVEAIKITPATEYVLETEFLEQGVERIQHHFDQLLKVTKSEEARESVKASIGQDIEKLRYRVKTPNIFKYTSLLFPKETSLK